MSHSSFLVIISFNVFSIAESVSVLSFSVLSLNFSSSFHSRVFAKLLSNNSEIGVFKADAIFYRVSNLGFDLSISNCPTAD